MVSALIYLQFHSIKNRTRVRLKRLKQPKYLFGAIVGGLYFYFYFFRWLFRAPGTSSGFNLAAASPETLALYESIAALMLCIIILLAWIIPHQRAALAFTEAEVAFLFPAPISRRGLIHFKLLRSQTAILFTTLLLTLLTNRVGGEAWIRAAGWWLVLSILNLHLLGSSFARTLLLDRGITNWQRRLAVLAIVLIGVFGVAIWAGRTLPVPDPSAAASVAALQKYAQQILVSGPVPYLLIPFRLVVRPFLAPTGIAFLWALGPALLLLLLHYWWVLRSDVAFEEASAEASKKLAEKISAARSGHWQSSSQKPKVRRAPFKLQPVGPPAIALLWKNLISAGQAFTLRVWVTMAAVAVGGSLALRQTSGGSSLAPAIGSVAGMLMIWALLIGPHLAKQDLRQDLGHADVLKTFPLRGWQIVLGELLAPAVILTGIQWFLLIIALSLFSQASGGKFFGWPGDLSIAAGLALLFPGLNLITLQIPNAAVLLFPAWFQTAKDGPHGVEATGQRLIFLLGQLLVFLVALIPAGAVFAGVLLLTKLVLATPMALTLAAVGAAAVLAVEAAVGVLVLGWLFERFDVAGELGS